MEQLLLLMKTLAKQEVPHTEEDMQEVGNGVRPFVGLFLMFTLQIREIRQMKNLNSMHANFRNEIQVGAIR